MLIRFGTVRALSAKTALFLGITCVMSVLNFFVPTCLAQEKPHAASQVELPKTWVVTWYQWQGPNQVLLQYSEKGGHTSTVQFNTKTASVTPLALSDEIKDALIWYGSVSWQLSPDNAWLTGWPGDDRHIAIEINGSKRIQTPMLGAWVNWMPDSHGWVEWNWKDHSTFIKLTRLSDDRSHVEEMPREYTLEDDWSLAGFVAPDKVLLYRSTAGHTWAARIVALKSKAETVMEWKLQVQNVYDIYGAKISPDLKHICWLTLTSKATLVPGIWLSDTDGKNQRGLWITGLDNIDRTTYWTTQKSWLSPSDIQWVSGSDKICFRQQGRLYTVAISK